jgi:hypothetical protein
MDRATHPPRVHVLHFVFDGWLGDQLVESFPCYLVTEHLAASFTAAGITGFEIAEAVVETSEEFKERHPDLSMPIFKWLQVVGVAGKSDLFINSDNRLTGSSLALDVVLATNPMALEFSEM